MVVSVDSSYLSNCLSWLVVQCDGCGIIDLATSFSKIGATAVRQIGRVCRTTWHSNFRFILGTNRQSHLPLTETPGIKTFLRLSSANLAGRGSCVETCRGTTSHTHPLAHRTLCCLSDLLVCAQRLFLFRLLQSIAVPTSDWATSNRLRHGTLLM